MPSLLGFSALEIPTMKVPWGDSRGDPSGIEPGSPDYTGRDQTRDPASFLISSWSNDPFPLELASRYIVPQVGLDYPEAIPELNGLNTERATLKNEAKSWSKGKNVDAPVPPHHSVNTDLMKK